MLKQIVGRLIINNMEVTSKAVRENSLINECPSIQIHIANKHKAICSAVDLILAVFPASLFWNLHMDWRQKASLSALMGLGIL